MLGEDAKSPSACSEDLLKDVNTPPSASDGTERNGVASKDHPLHLSTRHGSTRTVEGMNIVGLAEAESVRCIETRDHSGAVVEITVAARGMWDGEMMHPDGRAHPNLRADRTELLTAIREAEPAVMTSLRDEVLPIYMDQSDGGAAALDAALANWCRSFNFVDDWLSGTALNTLQIWTAEPEKLEEDPLTWQLCLHDPDPNRMLRGDYDDWALVERDPPFHFEYRAFYPSHYRASQWKKEVKRALDLALEVHIAERRQEHRAAGWIEDPPKKWRKKAKPAEPEVHYHYQWTAERLLYPANWSETADRHKLGTRTPETSDHTGRGSAESAISQIARRTGLTLPPVPQ